jgi:hypothetical protein
MQVEVHASSLWSVSALPCPAEDRSLTPCRFFAARGGACKYGTACRFAHDQAAAEARHSDSPHTTVREVSQQARGPTVPGPTSMPRVMSGPLYGVHLVYAWLNVQGGPDVDNIVLVNKYD